MSFYKKYQEAWDDQDIGASTMSGIDFVVGSCQSKKKEKNYGYGRSISATDNGAFKEA